ncbi:MAG: putative quinol monooxygenase [Planctomycetota bacterium]
MTTSKPTFAIVVTFQIKPEHVDAFRERMLVQASDSLRLEEGCHRFDVLTDEADSSVFVLYEAYTDAEAFEFHKQTEHFRDYDQCVQGWIASKSIQRLNLLENNDA